MNALQLLKQDHDKVKRLFAEFDSVDDGAPARKQELAAEIFRELQLHSRIEEEIFYPAVNAKADAQGKELVEDSYDAHAEVDELIEELKGMDPSDPDYSDKFQELMDDVEDHIDEEESEMFPGAQRKLGSELDELGREMQKEKASVPVGH